MLSHSALLLAALLHCTEASCELIGQFVLLTCPQDVCRLSWLVLLWGVDKERAELDGQGRPHQADGARSLWAGMVKSSAGGMHIKRLRMERLRQLLCPAAEWQQLLLSWESWQQVGEDNRFVIAAQEVPLPAAQRHEGEVALVASALIHTQTIEEED